MDMLTGQHSAAFDNPLRITESLRLDRGQHWLTTCRSPKAVRLFLWMAESPQLSCLSELDLTQVDMGRGHLHLVPQGE